MALPRDVKKPKYRSFLALGTKFEVDERYEIDTPMGAGAYGTVVSAHDRKNEDSLVAIKKIEKVFSTATFTKRTLRELKILRLLRHENIISIQSIQLPPSRENYEEIYVVSELMDSDLAAIIKSPQPLSDDHAQFFIYQILRGLKYIHSASIIHRDLKPRNLLVNANCDLKICDFGLARAHIKGLNFKSTRMTDYIATRWYRAPEVLLSCKKYTKAIDMWSVGCIVAELIGRKPLFPGSCTEHQIELICNLIGTPTDEEIERIPRVSSRDYVSNLERKEGVSFETLFPEANPLALDLMKEMLQFDPSKRISVEAALEHPYLESLHFPDDEPTREPVAEFDFNFEIKKVEEDELRGLIYDEVLLYHSEEWNEKYEKEKAEYETVGSKGEDSKVVTASLDVLHDESSSSDEEDLFRS